MAEKDPVYEQMNLNQFKGRQWGKKDRSKVCTGYRFRSMLAFLQAQSFASMD